MYLAVDVGGTKTLLAVFNEAGTIVERVKFPTPKDYVLFLETFAKNLATLEHLDYRACGLAIPGRVDRRHGIGVAFGNLPWQMVPIAQDIEHIVDAPVLIENDANLAGLSEALLIKDEFKKVVYVTISTGIGDALIMNGKIDSRFADSEAGLTLLEHDGRLQKWEDFASGSAILKKYGKKASEITDPSALYIIARNIALGLIHLVATLTPDVIILGGGVGAHYELFAERLNEQMKLYENPLVPTPPIRQAANPEDAVIYGCYHIVKDHYDRTHS